MPLSKPRHIKKPRLSLSCIVCRRRKVRCGREQPECANCVRMKDNCVYRAMVRDESTGRVRPLSPKEVRGSDARPDLPWPCWGQDANALYLDKPLRPPSRQLSTASPAPHRQELYPTAPSWEEATQLLRDRDAGVPELRGSSTTQDPSPVPTNSFPTLSGPLCSDYLSIRRGGRVRYIGRNFWGLVAGKESLSDDFFDKNQHTHPDLPLPHISSMGMFNLLRSLPTKPVSDTLLETFFLAVWPLVPLLHPPSLQTEYDEFWDWCRNSESALPSEKLRDDPTFICLLFAVLYCGASAAPAASWMYTKLQGLQKETTVSHLKSAFTTSLSLCQHLEHPTLNTLVSALLTGPFLDQPFEPMRSLVHVSTTVRIAQTMGLHRERTWSAMSWLDKEIRRRIWWHIVWLDVQSSISTGLTPCCGKEALETVSMVDLHEEPGEVPARLSQCNDSMTGGKSVAILYAIGRFETANLQARIVAHLQSAQGPTQGTFGELITEAKELLQNIDTIIARVPTQGIPERGYIPSRLANASPSTHPSLYKDDASQPTVFAAWTRIMLTLLKSEVAILLQKPFLPSPDRTNAQSRKSWTSMAQLCVNYLRIYLQLYQAPAFSPYAWFFCSYYGPLQCVFMTLIYLHSFEDSKETLLARYCVDEVIHHCVAQYQAPDSSSTKTSPDDADPINSKKRMPLVLQVLVDLHKRLDSSFEAEERLSLPLKLLECQAHFHMSGLATKASELRATSLPPSSDASSTTRTNRNCETPSMTTGHPPVVSGNKPGPPNSVLVAGSDSGLDMDFLATISDLEAWSSSLIMEPDNLLAHPDNVTPNNAVISGFSAHSTASGRRDLHESLDFPA
ncbi:hypothetical protein PENCOP_c005G02910 [Penicillium coprophilum]|uniref:Zn(2)-C6 fungal-type domain-containing protein n=1 Tax=Penicillium coprophilum TaxID=36646 RepID=A0A1V6UQX2_9EURO|nr:hypothetical protein PENCOP_c005G02910 [Penicillium coprophilum]